MKKGGAISARHTGPASRVSYARGAVSDDRPYRDPTTLAGLGPLHSANRFDGSTRLLESAIRLLREIVFDQEPLATLRAGAAAQENPVHHSADYQRRATVRAADVHFPVRQFDFSTRRGHRCIKAEIGDRARMAELSVSAGAATITLLKSLVTFRSAESATC